MKISGLEKTYSGRLVLSVESFEFLPGKVYAITGANGSGKSTFARILAGIIDGDHPGCVQRENGSIVQYSPQKIHAFSMNTLNNVLISGTGDRNRGIELLQKLDIKGRTATNARKLSGGELAKMALARVMMKKCDYLILDEPCSPMDIQSTLKAEQLIREYAKETGCCTILITHSLKQAERMADTMLFFCNGVLTEYGDTDKMLSAPDKQETREFLEF